MNQSKEKIIKRIKKNHTWLSMFSFITTVAFSSLLIVVFIVLLSSYLTKSKLSSEYDAIAYMAKIYESSGDDIPEASLYKTLNNEGRFYFIKDSAGNVLYQNGPITCDERKEFFTYNLNMKKIPTFTDKDNFFKEESDDGLIFDYRHALSLLVQTDFFEKETSILLNHEIGADEFFSDEAHIEDFAQNLLQFPIWFSIDVKNGSEKFIGKAHFKINGTDLTIFLCFIVFLILLAIIIFFILLIRLINDIRNQRKSLNLLFKDMTTDGHNLMWFLYKGQKILREKKNAKDEYAVVNLAFLKYTNFCTCHSISEGEKLLKDFYKTIESMLETGELISHSTSSNYAILLHCPDRDFVKDRVLGLIRTLEKTRSNHSFRFHAGIDFIEVSKNKNGKIVRRKKANLEQEYNNACTANTVIADKAESGIAVFDKEMVEEQKWMDFVQEEQKNALKNEEFIVYYQPKYNPSTNELSGAEALIRWNSPKHGFISPGKFIPIFETNGFITEIDHYMLSHVARDVKRWHDAGLTCVPISVNISRAHFIENNLAEQIRDSVDEAGAPRNLIEIELTESAFFDDKKLLISTISKLKEFGFAVSLDDFGSGFSSLNTLKDMPLDVLKIDAEFFRGESADTRGKVVVSETIRLAKSLNMKTVAEGIEVKDQVLFLAEQGCDMIQGFYFAKPMPGNEFEDRMRNPKSEKSDEPAETKAEEAEPDKADEPNEGENADGMEQENQSPEEAKTEETDSEPEPIKMDSDKLSKD
ncbi:MAG: EAL domain-containing protein [Treponema sp.]|nr:EAL domain-containing protein [Treponema sp.]